MMWVIISAFKDRPKLHSCWGNTGAWPSYIHIKCRNMFLLPFVLEWKVQNPHVVHLFSLEEPGTDPQQDDGWGCFKWSVHVHGIDLEDSTTSHWGDEEGLHRSGEEGPVQQHCENKWAPTLLSGLSHYCASPTYWFLSLHLKQLWHDSVTRSHVLSELFRNLVNISSAHLVAHSSWDLKK